MLGDGGDDVSIVTAVHPRGAVIVSSLGCFLSVGSSYKHYHPSLPVSFRLFQTQEYFKNNRWGG